MKQQIAILLIMLTAGVVACKAPKPSSELATAPQPVAPEMDDIWTGLVEITPNQVYEFERSKTFKTQILVSPAVVSHMKSYGIGGNIETVVFSRMSKDNVQSIPDQASELSFELSADSKTLTISQRRPSQNTGGNNQITWLTVVEGIVKKSP